MGTKFNSFNIFVLPEDCEKINKICSDYINGRISRDRCIEELYEVLRGQIDLFAARVHEYFKNASINVSIPHDDIISECKQQIVIAVDHLKPDGNYKFFVSRYVFQFVVKKIRVRWNLHLRKKYGIREILLYDVMGDDDGEDDMDEEEYSFYLAEDPIEDMYSAIEVRDFISKLSPIEQKFVQLLMDGYSQEETRKILGLSYGKSRLIITQIREKAAKYFNLSGGNFP